MYRHIKAFETWRDSGTAVSAEYSVELRLVRLVVDGVAEIYLANSYQIYRAIRLRYLPWLDILFWYLVWLSFCFWCWWWAVVRKNTGVCWLLWCDVFLERWFRLRESFLYHEETHCNCRRHNHHRSSLAPPALLPWIRNPRFSEGREHIRYDHHNYRNDSIEATSSDIRRNKIMHLVKEKTNFTERQR